MSVRVLTNNDKQKIKLKKNALEFVNKDSEKILDPKYKTELCKSWKETGFCVYGNKCRFAHGKNDIFGKTLNTNNYKLKQCNGFTEQGYCMYGSRCNFKHDERKLKEINRTFFSLSLSNFHKHKVNYEIPNKCSTQTRRLKVFSDFSKKNSPSSSSLSVASTSNNSPIHYDSNQMKYNLERAQVFNSCFNPLLSFIN